jgi:peptidyl-Lys metalloendopeptidase
MFRSRPESAAQMMSFMRLSLFFIAMFFVVSGCVEEEPEVVGAAPGSHPFTPRLPVKIPLRSDVSVSISIESTSENAILASYSIKNDSLDSIEIDTAEFPIRGVWMNVLDIKRDGVTTNYVGWLGESSHATTITITPGTVVSRVIDLNLFYSFTEIGNYEIKPRGVTFIAGGVKYRATATDAAKLPLMYGVTSSVPSPVAVRSAPGGSGTNSFPGVGATACTTTQQAQLIAARAAATVRAQNSYTSLAFGRNPSLYTRWMGTRTPGRYSHVEYSFKQIAYGLGVGDFKFFCDVNFVDFYAMVSPVAPYEIVLGSLFWPADANGFSDSKAGTLVHEVSHFNDVAGTGDSCSDYMECEALAISDPNAAYSEANCYEYYAETMNATQIAELAGTSIVPSSNVLSETSIDVCPYPTGVTFVGGRAYMNPIIAYTFNEGDYFSNTAWLSGTTPPVHCDYTSNGGNSISASGTPLVVPMSALLVAMGAL